MTVSQMFFNNKILDCDVNYEVYFKQYNKEKDKGENADMKKVKEPKYDRNNPEFKEFLRCLALTTTSKFAYTPKNEEIRAKTAKLDKISLEKVPKEPKPDDDGYVRYLEVKQKMIDEEAANNYIKREVQGDASETGLIKFAQPLLMEKYDGEYGEGL